MPTILPLAPSAGLPPDELLAPSSSTTYIDAPAGTLPLTGTQTSTYGHPIVYTDMPVGRIGGALILGGGIVKVGGTSVNQQPERRPRVYPQQAPPKLIHISYQVGHDAPTGTLRLTGTASEEITESREYAAPRSIGEPTIQDVLAAQRRARRIIRQKVGT